MSRLPKAGCRWLEPYDGKLSCTVPRGEGFPLPLDGTELILVDPWNTSRTCSGCGNVKADLQLSDRTYQCSCCGMVMDRDRNAAINILRRGLNTQTLRSAVNGRPCRPRWKETARGHESHQHAGLLAFPYFYTTFVSGVSVDLWLFVILLGFILWALIIANEVWRYLKARRNRESEA